MAEEKAADHPTPGPTSHGTSYALVTVLCIINLTALLWIGYRYYLLRFPTSEFESVRSEIRLLRTEMQSLQGKRLPPPSEVAQRFARLEQYPLQRWYLWSVVFLFPIAWVVRHILKWWFSSAPKGSERAEGPPPPAHVLEDRPYRGPDTAQISKSGLITHGLSLVLRDIDSLSYDVKIHEDKATAKEYRGSIHWLRDVTEKSLSITCLATFCYFVAKMVYYTVCIIQGRPDPIVTTLPLDIEMALTLAGFALVVDSFVVISTMVDAPGISRTLDAIIVALAGFIVMQVKATTGGQYLVEFQFQSGGPSIALVIGVLFLIRWIVHARNPLNDLGKRKQVGDS